MMSAAETIKRIRLDLCLERGEFAKLLDITVSAVGFYETGKRKPKLSIIRRIKELAKKNGMNYTTDDFVGE